MGTLYVVLDIGCMECGEVTEVLGVCEDKDHAREIFFARHAEVKPLDASCLEKGDILTDAFHYDVTGHRRVEIKEFPG